MRGPRYRGERSWVGRVAPRYPPQQNHDPPPISNRDHAASRPGERLIFSTLVEQPDDGEGGDEDMDQQLEDEYDDEYGDGAHRIKVRMWARAVSHSGLCSS